ncbi:MAG: serine/threonine protein kinase [bacterium]
MASLQNQGMEDLKHIGDIQVFAEIHQGATSTVYKGFQSSQNRVVLLKVLRPEFAESDKFSRGFQEEANLIAKIQHPNVVAIYEHGRFERWHYFATEFVDGLDLRSLLEDGKLPADLAWFIIVEVAKGLKAAHKENIVHKDIKPSNVLISNAGEVKIADFGMADLRQGQSNAVEEIRGTLGYFSPEQILGESQGKYSDVFALGATLYEILSGTAAFHGATPSDYFNSILHDEPIRFLQRDTRVPAGLIDICSKMLSKKASDRYQSCDELLTDLNDFGRRHKLTVGAKELAAYLQDPSSFSPTVFKLADENAVKQARHQPGLYLAVFAALVVTALGYYTIWPSKEPATPRINGSGSETDVFAELPLKSANASGDSDDTRGDIAGLPSPAIDRLATVPESSGDELADPEIPTTGALVDSFATDNEDGGDTGFLNLRCRPWAYVFIDGDSLGMTPLQDSLKLRIGNHRIVFKNPLFPEHSTDIEIKANGLQHFEFSLWSIVGKLTLEVSPWAEVYIDGEYRDTIPPQNQPFLLRPGEHALMLKHPSLGNFDTSFEIRASQELNLRFNLKSLLSR